MIATRTHNTAFMNNNKKAYIFVKLENIILDYACKSMFFFVPFEI